MTGPHLEIRLIDRSEQTEHPCKDRQTDDSIDDRWNAGQIRNVQIDDPVELALLGIFLEIQGRPRTNRNRREPAHDADEYGSPQGGLDARLFRIARGIAGQKIP